MLKKKKKNIEHGLKNVKSVLPTPRTMSYTRQGVIPLFWKDEKLLSSSRQRTQSSHIFSLLCLQKNPFFSNRVVTCRTYHLLSRAGFSIFPSLSLSLSLSPSLSFRGQKEGGLKRIDRGSTFSTTIQLCKRWRKQNFGFSSTWWVLTFFVFLDHWRSILQAEWFIKSSSASTILSLQGGKNCADKKVGRWINHAAMEDKKLSQKLCTLSCVVHYTMGTPFLTGSSTVLCCNKKLLLFQIAPLFAEDSSSAKIRRRTQMLLEEI